MQKFFSPAFATLIVVAVSAVFSTAWAVEPAELAHHFRIEPQSLRTAAPRLAQQAGLQFAMADDGRAAHIRVNRVSGTMATTEALRRMLESTGVTYEMARPDLIVFQVPPRQGRGMPELLIAANRERGDVTGFSGGLWPTRIVGADEFPAAAPGTLADALKDISLTGLANRHPGELGSIAGNQQEIDMMGFGPTDLTVLLNGRPMAGVWLGGSPLQPSLRGIPFLAVAGMSIVPGSTSSIYGGGAVGTVDVMLRGASQGLKIDAALGGADTGDAGAASASVSYGDHFFDGRTQISVNFAAQREHPLLMSDRRGLERARLRILQNNPSYWFSLGAPVLGGMPNVASADGGDLGNGLGPFAHLGANYRTDPTVLKNGAGYSFTLANSVQSDGGARALLYGGMEAQSLILNLDQEITSSHSVYMELLATSLQSRTPASAAGFLGLDGVLVPARSQVGTNPFDRPVFITRAIDGADGVLDERNKAWRGTLGTRWRVNDDWSLSAEYIHSLSRLRWTQPAARSAAEDAASGTLDVFRDPALGSPDVSSYLYTLGTSWLPSESSIGMLRAQGMLAEGESGYANVTIGATRRADRYGDGMLWRETLTESPVEQQHFSRQYQSTWSALAELNTRYRQVELQVSGRWDRTEMEVNAPSVPADSSATPPPVRPEFRSFSPTATLHWRPVDDLVLRTRVGRGFVMPVVTELAPAPPRPVPLGMFLDPQRGGEPVVGAMVVNGGNPALEPETAQTFSAGILYSPRWLERTQFSVDRTRVRKKGDIESLAGFSLQDLEHLDSSRITRGDRVMGDPWNIGRVVSLDLSDANLSRVEAILWQAEARGATDAYSWGTLAWSVGGTLQPRFERQLTADSPVRNEAGLGWESPLGSSAVARLSWKLGSWTVGWSARHYGSYRVSDDPTIIANQGGDGRIPGQTFHDLEIGWRWRPLSSWATSMDLRLAVANIFDREPEFDAGAARFGYYSPYADPRLRHGVLMLSVTF